MKKQSEYDAHQLLNMLAAKHSEDVFIPECKDGPTHYSTHLRMDAWTMKRSWAHPCATAYEIKVSRSDFLKDNKWPGYLPCCNQFYFVAPKNLLTVSEIPEAAGLMVAVGKDAGARLLTQKKAPWRDVSIPDSIYRYILMSRTKIKDEYRDDDSVRYWRDWLAKKVDEQELGYRVSRRIRERATELEIRDAKLTQQMRTYDSVRATLETLGFSANSHIPWDLERRIKEQQRVFDQEVVDRMTAAKSAIERALMMVAEIEEASGNSGNGKANAV